MKIYEAQTDCFSHDPVCTEYVAYRELKESPLAVNVCYLAVHWASLINQKKLADFKIPKIGPGFTICQHIKYELILPILKKAGINLLFTPHVYRSYWGIKVLPFPHEAVHAVGPAEKKDIFYSFIGLDSTSLIGSSLRRNLLDARHPAHTVVLERKYWHWARENNWGSLSSEDQQKEKSEYQDILARSRYSLCPRGTGASTIRFWESLKSGAIPVLISDAMRLPEGYPWHECVIRIKEKAAGSVADVLNQIPEEKEKTMREKALEAYQTFSKKNIVRNIRQFYERQSRSR